MLDRLTVTPAQKGPSQPNLQETVCKVAKDSNSINKQRETTGPQTYSGLQKFSIQPRESSSSLCTPNIHFCRPKIHTHCSRDLRGLSSNLLQIPQLSIKKRGLKWLTVAYKVLCPSKRGWNDQSHPFVVLLFSHVRLFVTPWTRAHQALLSSTGSSFRGCNFTFHPH